MRSRRFTSHRLRITRTSPRRSDPAIPASRSGARSTNRPLRRDRRLVARPRQLRFELLWRLDRGGGDARCVAGALDGDAPENSRPGRRLGITVATPLAVAWQQVGHVAHAAPIFEHRADAFPRTDLFPATARPGGVTSFRRSSTRCSATAPGVLDRRRRARGPARTAGEYRGRSSLSRASPSSAGWRPPRACPPKLAQRRDERRWVLVAVALTALACSLAPEQTFGAMTISDLPRCSTGSRRCSGPMRVSAWSSSSWPRCWPDRPRRARRTRTPLGGSWRRCSLAMAAGEYAVSPSALWRDIRPDEGASMGRPSTDGARPRLRAADPGVLVGAVAHGRSRHAAGRPPRTAWSRIFLRSWRQTGTHLVVRRGSIVSERPDDHALPKGWRLPRGSPMGGCSRSRPGGLPSTRPR